MSGTIQHGFNVSPKEAFQDFADGMVDAVYGAWMFPTHVVKNVLGVDHYFGENADWSEAFQNYNGFADGVCRVPSIFNHIILGTANTITGGLPHIVVNQWMGIDNDFFAPPPRNWRETAQYLTGELFIGVGIKYGTAFSRARAISLQREALIAEVRSIPESVVVDGPRVIVPKIRWTPEQLAQRAVTGEMSKADVGLFMSKPSPELIPFVRTWLILKPESLVLDMRTFIKAIVDTERISDDAMYVLSSLARQGNTKISWALSRLLGRLPQYRSALIVTMTRDPDFWLHVPWDDLVIIANESRSTSLYRDIVTLMETVGDPAKEALYRLEPERRQCVVTVAEPAVANDVTVMDIKAGRGAILARDILKGTHPPTARDIQSLGFFARHGVTGAIDALYKVASGTDQMAQTALGVLKELNKDSPHHKSTIVVMLGRLAEMSTAPEGLRPVEVIVSSEVATLMRYITLHPAESMNFAKQLIAKVVEGDHEAILALTDLYSTSDVRVATLLKDAIIGMVKDGRAPVQLLQGILKSIGAGPCLQELVTALRVEIDILHNPIFDPLLPILDNAETRLMAQ